MLTYGEAALVTSVLRGEQVMVDTMANTEIVFNIILMIDLYLER